MDNPSFPLESEGGARMVSPSIKRGWGPIRSLPWRRARSNQNEYPFGKGGGNQFDYYPLKGPLPGENHTISPGKLDCHFLFILEYLVIQTFWRRSKFLVLLVLTSDHKALSGRISVILRIYVVVP